MTELERVRQEVLEVMGNKLYEQELLATFERLVREDEREKVLIETGAATQGQNPPRSALFRPGGLPKMREHQEGRSPGSY